jgi:hypothetical protein
MRRVAALSVVVLCFLASLTAAQASTTIGQTGAPDPATYQAANGPGGYEIITPSSVVPAGGGTVVSLNTQSSTCLLDGIIPLTLGAYDLQVLRPLGGDQYRVLGHTGNQIDPCDSLLHSYPVNIPVQDGDVLGVFVANDWMGVLTDAAGAIVYSHPLSDPAVGDTISVPTSYIKTMDESATLVQQPTSANVCKNGGWKSLVDNSGTAFKNQGDCVSFVATHGKNSANG